MNPLRNSSRHITLTWCALLAVVVLPSLHRHSSVIAEEGTPAEARPRIDVASLQADVKRRLERLEPQFSAENESEVSLAVSREYDVLSWLDLTYVQITELQAKQQEVTHQIEAFKNELDTTRKFGLSDVPPYSYLILDDLRNEILTVEERLQSLTHRGKGLTSAFESAQFRKGEAETKRRLAEEAYSSSLHTETKEALREEYEDALLSSQAAKAALEQLRAEADLNEAEQQAATVELEVLRHKEQIVAADVRFTREDLASRLVMLDKTESQLRDNLATRFSELSKYQKQLPADSDDKAPLEAAEDKVLKLRISLRQEEIGIIHQLLRELVEVRAVWRWRYELANGLVSVEELHQWQKMLENATIRVDGLRETLQNRMDELRDQMMVVRKEIFVPGDSSDEPLATLALENTEFEQSLQFLSEYMAFARAGNRLMLKAAAETDAAMEPVSKASAFAEASYWFDYLWNYEITVVDDHSITFGKVLCGILLLLGSTLLARVISRALGRRLLPRLGFNETAVLAFQSICFYTLLCSFAFIVLEFVNVPVTGFAFLGGAIAIGVGFGSQNIVNNFISGLIILAERPIRPGDLVEIDGLSANIEHIGARSTRVKTG
ncbi:MAG: mechanosensitive ion channel domain-containing protein, partial [Planctomycetota bacterium]